MLTETEIQSPCIGVCAMDEATGFCQGCYRTIDEIKQWWDLDNAQKQEVVVEANARLEQQFD
jgi:predicted Fe-S protein YdhL (DUF1289 family)